MKIGNSDADFEEFIEIRAYNTFSAIAMKALQEIINNSSNSASKVMEFQKRLEELLQKS